MSLFAMSCVVAAVATSAEAKVRHRVYNNQVEIEITNTDGVFHYLIKTPDQKGTVEANGGPLDCPKQVNVVLPGTHNLHAHWLLVAYCNSTPKMSDIPTSTATWTDAPEKDYVPPEPPAPPTPDEQAILAEGGGPAVAAALAARDEAVDARRRAEAAQGRATLALVVAVAAAAAATALWRRLPPAG